MKLLLTGANGQVAFDVLRLANTQMHPVFFYTRNELDIMDVRQIKQILQVAKPDIVINTAAYTKVDQAEEDIAHCFSVNRDGAKNIAMACEAEKIPLLHLSTDYIFDGNKAIPYQENDPVSPINSYGQSKWEGEEAIRQHCENHLILRVSSVFGVQGTNFVKTIMKLAQQNEILRIVADQTMCPTPAFAIADTLLQLAECMRQKSISGTYHFCGDTAVTWYDFAVQIVEQSARHFHVMTQKIDAIPSQEYPTRARRPRYSVLNCHALEKTFGIKPANWQAGLSHVINHLLAS